MDITDGKQLQRIFPSIIDDFNNRPHISLDGLTPTEAEQNISLNSGKLRFYTVKAAEERKRYNQTTSANIAPINILR